MNEIIRLFARPHRPFVILGILIIITGYIGGYLNKNKNENNNLITTYPKIERGDTSSTKNIIVPAINKNDETQAKKKKSEESKPPPTKMTSTFIADYLISSQTSNQIEELLNEIQTLVEQNGFSANTDQNGNFTPLGLKGKYKKLIVLSGKLNSSPSSIDQSAISTSYSYSIKIYDIENSKLINSKSDKVISVGFSESENVEKIKKQIIPQIKLLL